MHKPSEQGLQLGNDQSLRGSYFITAFSKNVLNWNKNKTFSRQLYCRLLHGA